MKTKTVSLWSLVLSNTSDFENPLYNPATQSHVLFPLTSMRHLRLWDKYYCRWNPSMRQQVGGELGTSSRRGREVRIGVIMVEGEDGNAKRWYMFVERMVYEVVAVKDEMR